MAAPDRTVWGDIVNSKGRIGISLTETSTATTYTVSAGTWFWSKYECTDNTNKIYFDENASSASTYRGSASISHTVSSGDGWSTRNQTKLLDGSDYTYTYTRGTTAKTIYYRAKLMNVEAVDGTMHVKASATIPALDTYTITYNANGGTGAPATQSKWYGISINISSTVPTKTGYSFVGWGKSSTTTTVSYYPGGSCGENTNLTLYAIWKANTYTVSYDANGGTGAPSSQTKTHDVALTLSSTIPTRTNYNFVGWGTSSVATTASYSAGGSYTTNASITLYAVWTLGYTEPRVTNLSVTRCTSDGSASDDGTYFKVTFDWNTDKTVSSISVSWKLSSDTEWTSSTNISASGTSGNVNQVFGANAISTESVYTVRISVSDASGTTSVDKALAAKAYFIDCSPNKGVGILLPAEDWKCVKIGAPTYVEGVQITGLTLKLGGLSKPTNISGDTGSNWANTGNMSTYFYDTSGLITDQPSQYGFMLNLTNSWNVHQLWFTYSDGLAHRAGNKNGWEGTWRKILDNKNYSGYCLPLSGGTTTGSVYLKAGTNSIGNYRAHWAWFGFYANANDAANQANRKGWIGFNETENFTFYNDSTGSNVSNKTWTISSDRRLKQDIADIPEEFINIWNELLPKVFKWNDLNSGDGKYHFGLIAQDVITTFEKYGLDYTDYGFVNTFTMTDDDTEYFGIAYDEYHMLSSLVLKHTVNKLEEQRKQIDSLQTQIDELRNLITNMSIGLNR